MTTTVTPVPSPFVISPVPTDADPSQLREARVRDARVLNYLLLRQYTVRVTLAPNDTATVFADSRIGVNSLVLPTPITASAAIAFASGALYTVPQAGAATIFHPSKPATDQTFGVLILG